MTIEQVNGMEVYTRIPVKDLLKLKFKDFVTKLDLWKMFFEFALPNSISKIIYNFESDNDL
jgi:hypothetical protein